MTEKMIYSFGAGQTDGSADMRELLGGKGANLAEMASLDIPVPPGFTITTQVCVDYLKQNAFPEGLWEGAKEQMARLEEAMGAQFGGDENPLLVSVRSGARDSMPGMMDTVLNLGMNDETVLADAVYHGTPILDAFQELRFPGKEAQPERRPDAVRLHVESDLQVGEGATFLVA